LKDTKHIKPTINDIAKIANTSASTVSRALNNHPKINQKTKEKIWRIARELNYKTNTPAFIDVEKSKTICLMIPDIKNTFYISILESIQKYTIQNSYNLYIAYTNNTHEIEKQYVDSIVNLNIEGVIVILFDRDIDLDYFKQLDLHNIPNVFINKIYSKNKSYNIIPDVLHGAYKATNHFTAMNCKRISLFVNDINTAIDADLYEGFMQALNEEGITNEQSNIFEVNNSGKKYIDLVLNKLLLNKDFPEAILAADSKISQHIINWLSAHQLEVPRDTLLVSCDNVDESNNLISSIYFSGTKIGTIAIKQLFNEIEGGKKTIETKIIPAKFIIKRSSLKV